MESFEGQGKKLSIFMGSLSSASTDEQFVNSDGVQEQTVVQIISNERLHCRLFVPFFLVIISQ